MPSTECSAPNSLTTVPASTNSRYLRNLDRFFREQKNCLNWKRESTRETQGPRATPPVGQRGEKTSQEEKSRTLREAAAKLLRDGGLRWIADFVDGEHVRALFVPLAKSEAAGGKEAADGNRIPAEDFLQDRDENAHGIVAKNCAS